MRTPILLVLAAGALVLDPVSACIGSPSFTFGEREMRTAVEGTWQLTIAAESYTLEIKQSSKAEHAERGWIKSAAACGSRSFVRNAAACLDTTHMPLEVHVAGGPEASGELLVVGTTFTNGQLALEVGAHSISAKISPTGAVDGAPAAYTKAGVDSSAVKLLRVAAK